MSENLKFVDTPALRVAYEERGDPAAPAVLLVHGWPDDVRTWDAVVDSLVGAGVRPAGSALGVRPGGEVTRSGEATRRGGESAPPRRKSPWGIGVRTVCPYLRGFGPTRFRDPGVLRGGQIAALGQDLADFIEALDLDRFILVGHDWGARAAYVAAALVPRRIRGLVALSVGYGTSTPHQVLSFEQARQYWYHWYFALERGREALAADRRGFVQRIWRLWSPSWRFSAVEFEATALSFDNPDWVDVTIHSYRHRWGNAAGDPRYAELESRLAAPGVIEVPTLMLHGAEDGATLPETSAGKERHFSRGYRREVLAGVGHFPQREAPATVVSAVLELARGAP